MSHKNKIKKCQAEICTALNSLPSEELFTEGSIPAEECHKKATSSVIESSMLVGKHKKRKILLCKDHFDKIYQKHYLKTDLINITRSDGEWVGRIKYTLR